MPVDRPPRQGSDGLCHIRGPPAATRSNLLRKLEPSPRESSFVDDGEGGRNAVLQRGSFFDGRGGGWRRESVKTTPPMTIDEAMEAMRKAMRATGPLIGDPNENPARTRALSPPRHS